MIAPFKAAPTFWVASTTTLVHYITSFNYLVVLDTFGGGSRDTTFTDVFVSKLLFGIGVGYVLDA